MNQQQNLNSGRPGNSLFPSIAVIALAVIGGWYYYQSQRQAQDIANKSLETIQAAQNQANAALNQAAVAMQGAQQQANQLMGQANQAMKNAGGMLADDPTTDMKGRLDPSKLAMNNGTVEMNIAAALADRNAKIGMNSGFILDKVSFGNGNANLSPTSQAQIAAVSAVLKTYPASRISINGYTDNVGIPGANITLSQSRADAVKAALISQGISKDRIEAHGLGDKNPVADNGSTAGRAANQRIELALLSR